MKGGRVNRKKVKKKQKTKQQQKNGKREKRRVKGEKHQAVKTTHGNKK